MASLRRLFDHLHPRGLVEMIISAPIPLLSAACPSEVQNLCMSLLRRDPAKRPLAQDLVRGPAVQSSMRSLFNEDVKAVAGLVDSRGKLNWRPNMGKFRKSATVDYAPIKNPG